MSLPTHDPRLPRLSGYLAGLKLADNIKLNILVAAGDDLGLRRLGLAGTSTSSSEGQASGADAAAVDPAIQRSWSDAFAKAGRTAPVQQGPSGEAPQADQAGIDGSWDRAFGQAKATE